MLQYLDKLECLSWCDHTIGCATVNHNSETTACELLNPGPWIPTAASDTESNWFVYYKGDRRVPAVNAWQSSTRFSATFAIDGHRKNTVWEECTHTEDYQSKWTMEFEDTVNVSHVIVYFVNSETYNYRNTNLRFLISETRQDYDNNIGTDCATYIGPPASPAPPVKITCSSPVLGKFLNIILNVAVHLTLCEVEVFTT